MDRGAGQATVHGVTKSHTTEHPHALRQCTLQGRYDRHLSLQTHFLPLSHKTFIILAYHCISQVPSSHRFLEHAVSFAQHIFFLNIYLFGCTRSQLWHVGSSSLTRDGTQAVCIGSAGSQSLDHQGSPQHSFLHSFIEEPVSFIPFKSIYHNYFYIVICAIVRSSTNLSGIN